MSPRLRRETTVYLVRYLTHGSRQVREARVYAPGPESARSHVLAGRRDVLEILSVEIDETAS